MTGMERKEWTTYTRKDVLYHEVIEAEVQKAKEAQANRCRHLDEEIFSVTGDYGKYQKLLTWFVILPACLPCGLQGFNQLFMANSLGHWCQLPSILMHQTNFTLEQLKRLALPIEIEGNKTSSCLIKDIDWTHTLHQLTLSIETDAENDFPYEEPRDSSSSGHQDLSKFGNYEAMMDELNSTSWQLISCPNGWDYEDGSSIVRDFDLVCGREIYPTLALFLVNLGGLFGVFMFGLLADWIGRKASFFACLACEMIGGIGCVFAPNFWIWTLFRVLVGLTVPAIYQIPFIICLELVGPTYRTFVTVMTSFFYVIGMLALPIIAFLIPDWKLLSLTTTTPFLLYFLYIWFLPESFRWLLAQGRKTEALQILENLARVNGKILPSTMAQTLGLTRDREERVDYLDHHHHHHPKNIKSKDRNVIERRSTEPSRLLDLFRTPNMRLKTALLTLCWFSNCTVYVGLSYYGPSLGENPYLSFFLSSLIEIPGYFLCWALMDRWGRRWPLCLSMLVGGAFDIGTALLSSDSRFLLMTFYLIAKLGISSSYLIIYPFAGELYPTHVRGIGLGFSAYIGGIGLCFIPLINYLGRENLVFPLVVMGVLSMIGGLAGLRLPETLNASLPQTIEEGEEFGKYFTWRECLDCASSSTNSSELGSSTSLVLELEKYTKESGDEEKVKFHLVQVMSSSSKGPRESDVGGDVFPLVILKEPTRTQLDSSDTLGDHSPSNVTTTTTPLRDEGGTILQMNDSTTLTKRTKGDGGNGESNVIIFSDSSHSGPSHHQDSRVEQPRATTSSSRRTSSRRKRLQRQGSSVLEAPTDSTGAFIITPWW